MDREYSAPFISGTQAMLSTMVGVSCELKTGPDDGPAEFVSGTVFFKGPSPGQLTMVFPQNTARQIVSRMLGMDESETDDETLQDGVGEMANIVAGNVKAALSDSPYHLTLSLPSVRCGLEPFPEGADLQDCRLTTPLGDFHLMFYLSLGE